MELLDEMRMDMANFLVQQIRPQIMQQSVAYERKKFVEFLERQKSRLRQQVFLLLFDFKFLLLLRNWNCRWL